MKNASKYKFRFVVLHHTGWPGQADHYDLMLQVRPGTSDDDRVLKTFATCCDQFPTGDIDVFRLVEDHRRAYLQFEGDLSGKRGQVRRADKGELTFVTQFDPN